MHGVKRARVHQAPDSAEVAKQKQEKETKKINEYKALLDELVQKNADKDYSKETLELSTRVLGINPEFVTGWSIRRRVLKEGILKGADLESRQKTLEADLYLTNQSLKQNPKTYAVWEHRKWVLETMPDADWGMEMKMVEAYLQKDGRNFHSWGYRRYLVASILSLPPPSDDFPRSKPLTVPTTASELAYTKKKISENFSNFSAWHYRSKLLPKYWEEQGWAEGSEERKKNVDEEFELVKQAYWSDPNDQSAWLYLRWLVGKGSPEVLRREISGIEELLEEEPDSRWCLESLVWFKSQLIEHLKAEGDAAEREEMTASVVEMLEKLATVDPERVQRYNDLSLALWLSPSSAEVDSAFSSLIKDLSTTYGTSYFDPHVTLLTGMTVDTPTQLILDQIKAGTSAFRSEMKGKGITSLDLTLQKLGTNGTFFQYVFAQVDSANPALTALRAAVRASCLPHLTTPDDYFPHLSLVYGTDTEERTAEKIISGLEKSEVTVGEGKCAVKGVTTFNVAEILLQWINLLRLANWEQTRVHEIHTRILFHLFDNLRQLTVCHRRGGWLNVKLPGTTEWRRLWTEVNLRLSEVPGFRYGEYKPEPPSSFNENPDVTGPAYVFFETAPDDLSLRKAVCVMQDLSVYKIEGTYWTLVDGRYKLGSGSESAFHQEGYALLGVENPPDVETTTVSKVVPTLEWVLATYDCFKLYGRPGPLSDSLEETTSMLYALPYGNKRPKLFIHPEGR
ncbi:hypothetical protein MNV49_005277 [Pseudohyphozyma bogoriensis]|nr:hypothetical protein MNV49_005277 [Pseudohyphozyma bogoriensis]